VPGDDKNTHPFRQGRICRSVLSIRLLLIHQKHVTDLLTAISEQSHENDRIPETVTGRGCSLLMHNPCRCGCKADSPSEILRGSALLIVKKQDRSIIDRTEATSRHGCSEPLKFQSIDSWAQELQVQVA